MKTERSQVGIGFWFWWMIAGVTGLGVGLGLLVALIETLASLSSIVSSITVVAVAGAVVGASLGVAQWLVMRRHIPRAGWWVLATVLGMAVGFALANVNFDPMDIATPGFVVGASLGTTQWLVLRRHIPRGWLVGASHPGLCRMLLQCLCCCCDSCRCGGLLLRRTCEHRAPNLVLGRGRGSRWGTARGNYRRPLGPSVPTAQSRCIKPS